jgi:hypothetical protein
VPRQRVGRAPELLLDEEPLDVAPALAAVLDGVQAAGERRSIAAWRIAAIRSAGSRPRARSASTSSGNSTSSTKARARACSSACSGVSVDASATISVVMDPWG